MIEELLKYLNENTDYEWKIYKILLGVDFYEIFTNKDGKTRHFQIGGELLKEKNFEIIKNWLIGELE